MPKLCPTCQLYYPTNGKCVEYGILRSMPEECRWYVEDQFRKAMQAKAERRPEEGMAVEGMTVKRTVAGNAADAGGKTMTTPEGAGTKTARGTGGIREIEKSRHVQQLGALVQPRRKAPPEVEAEILRLAKEGLSQRAIAEKLGLNSATPVSRIVRQHGIGPAWSPPTRRKLSAPPGPARPGQEGRETMKVVERLRRVLTYNEWQAVRTIVEALSLGSGGSPEQRFTTRAARITMTVLADKAGVTRSTIVNALRICEAAGVLASRSCGMKGTYVEILDLGALQELAKGLVS